MTASKHLSFAAIYTITCTANGRVYVGQTRKVVRRWQQHRWDLDRGVHRNIHLQNAWKKYGQSAFVFAIAVNLSGVAPEDLDARLNEAEVSVLASYPDTFNLMEAALSGTTPSQETLEKLSSIRKSMWQDPEFRDRQQKSRKAKAATPEWKANHAKTLEDRRNDPKWIEKMKSVNKANWQLPNSEERRQRRAAQEKAAWQDPEYRERQKKARSLAWQDPEVRAKRIEGLKAAHARRRAAKATEANLQEQ